jgi:hypothetical protein
MLRNLNDNLDLSRLLRPRHLPPANTYLVTRPFNGILLSLRDWNTNPYEPNLLGLNTVGQNESTKPTFLTGYGFCKSKSPRLLWIRLVYNSKNLWGFIKMTKSVLSPNPRNEYFKHQRYLES